LRTFWEFELYQLNNNARKGKGKQAWTGPEDSRKLRFPDFVTTAQDGGKLSAAFTPRKYA